MHRSFLLVGGGDANLWALRKRRAAPRTLIKRILNLEQPRRNKRGGHCAKVAENATDFTADL
jgi:hypothetical protein